MSVKTKITLSLSKDIVDEIRRELTGESFSRIVEKSLENTSGVLFIKKISSTLNLEREIVSPKDVPKIRKKVRDVKAEEVVREIRESRV
ncbi:hypothetical protein DRO97_11190 [Archaeoglobales archaeon]|nr:MAG: hypothetical protein DRO97_11190 [Archaeoglobales archaeon]